MNTAYSKNSMGLYEGYTYHSIPDLGLSLKILTMKRSNGRLQTTASCCAVFLNFETHRVYQDFYQVVMATNPARVTAGAVKGQHEKVLQDFDLLVQQALHHYNTPEYIAKYGKETA